MFKARMKGVSPLLAIYPAMFYAHFVDDVFSGSFFEEIVTTGPILIMVLMVPMHIHAALAALRYKRHGVDDKRFVQQSIAIASNTHALALLLIILATIEYPITLLLAIVALKTGSRALNQYWDDYNAFDDPQTRVHHFHREARSPAIGTK